jgi:hypothetical protein
VLSSESMRAVMFKELCDELGLLDTQGLDFWLQLLTLRLYISLLTTAGVNEHTMRRHGSPTKAPLDFGHDPPGSCSSRPVLHPFRPTSRPFRSQPSKSATQHVCTNASNDTTAISPRISAVSPRPLGMRSTFGYYTMLRAFLFLQLFFGA